MTMGFLARRSLSLAIAVVTLLLTIPPVVKGCTDILVTPGASLDGKQMLLFSWRALTSTHCLAPLHYQAVP